MKIYWHFAIFIKNCEKVVSIRGKKSGPQVFDIEKVTFVQSYTASHIKAWGLYTLPSSVKYFKC